MTDEHRKHTGAYFTPLEVAGSLVRWAVRSPRDLLLDPSCGDGRFLAEHRRCEGVEFNENSVSAARTRAPHAKIHQAEFFGWAATQSPRFDAVVGNPPFIRYQQFAGEVRAKAASLCAARGASFSGLASSWAPFLVGAASLLKKGGRLSFVVPAEVGHVPYARPLLEYLASNFGRVHITAVRKKIFRELSEGVWLMFAEGFGESTQIIELAQTESFFASVEPPRATLRVSLDDWRSRGCRLRPFLLPSGTRKLYERLEASNDCFRFDTVAKAGIGYVTGANDFFHLRPSEAAARGIPEAFLKVAVRNGRMLDGESVTSQTVARWIERDEPVLLLRLNADSEIPPTVRSYLRSAKGREARLTYKCRNRDPWYAVPDVTVPDAFLSYMSSGVPSLSANQAGCVCTNSLHAVRVKRGASFTRLLRAWRQPLAELSCEIEGHPLGGGMLKVEPGETANILLSNRTAWTSGERALIEHGIESLRSWRLAIG